MNVLDDIDQPSIPPTNPPSLHMFEGSTNFKIENSILTNAQGDVKIYKFDVGSPLSDDFKSLLTQHVAGLINVQDLDKTARRYFLIQAIRNLPCAKAAYNDYTPSNLRRVSCFSGTRQALLQEFSQWLVHLGRLRVYLLSGNAGIGKSTVAQTIATRADNLRLLGASFFFSRDEASRKNAERFFTTIAFQLCAYDKQFSEAIGTVLTEERGAAAVLKDPQEQLRALILEPLRDIAKTRQLPTLIVVDALDECDDQDAPTVLGALNRLVQELPCFKVFVTTRPQPHLPPIPSTHNVFYLQNIEDKIVNSDIQRYLKYNLSQPQVAESMHGLITEWNASNEEISSLVQAADKLFIVASTAVRFILDTTVYNPQSQMEVLKTNGQVILRGLESFYNVILRRAVPLGNSSMAQRFVGVIGTILVAQEPLPIKILVHLTYPFSVYDIKGTLAHLQSVVALSHDTPRIYHKSFFDFLTDADHCAEDLRIDMKAHHTRVAICCLQIMNKNLKQNILDLGTPARFMDNDKACAADNIAAEKLMEKIPGELMYACIYWANHVQSADTEDVSLTKEVDTFLTVHLLHWLETLSWIRELDVAYVALCMIRNAMKLASSNLDGILSDALRFITRFSREFQRSALHIYYSALPCTPKNCLLYKSYSKETLHGLCRVEGILPQWDGLITYFRQGNAHFHIMFSHDNSKFVSSSHHHGEMRLWDAETGTLLRAYDGHNSAIAGDFSVVAILNDLTATFWNVASNVPVVTVTMSAEVVELTLSFDGSRLAVGLSNGTVGLWDVQKGELIAGLEGYPIPPEDSYQSHDKQFGFSPKGYGLAFVSYDGEVQLYNGEDGEFIARLNYESKKHYEFVFSRDGCRLASLVDENGGRTLTLWDVENGALISVARNVGGVVAISEDGTFIATGEQKGVQLWSGNPLSLIGTVDIGDTYSLAISGDMLAIGSEDVTLYGISNRSVIATFQSVLPGGLEILALSPDCTRLAVGHAGGSELYDVPLIKASVPSQEQHWDYVSALAFSPDSSRLASAFGDGAVALWDPSRTDHPIATHKLHSEDVTTLAFSLDGAQIASGSEDETVRFWDGKDGAPIGKLEHPFTEAPIYVASSPDLLAVATSGTITLFDHNSLCLIDTLNVGGSCLSFSADGSLLASVPPPPYTPVVTVWNVAERTAIVTFEAELSIHGLSFSPDGSQLSIQSRHGDGLFDVVNKHALELTESEDLSWVPNLMNGVLISWKYGDFGDCLVGQFSGHKNGIPILYIPELVIPNSFTFGSSIIALGCANGRVLFVKFPATGSN